MRYVIIGVGLVVLAVLVVVLGTDEGEVVTLVTRDSRNIEYETGLWIVEVDGHLYLRADSPSAYWLGRIRQQPEVELVRDGQRRTYRATPSFDNALAASVSKAMSEKYGRVDRWLTAFRDYSDSVPILLEPLEAGGDEVAGDAR